MASAKDRDDALTKWLDRITVKERQKFQRFVMIMDRLAMHDNTHRLMTAHEDKATAAAIAKIQSLYDNADTTLLMPLSGFKTALGFYWTAAILDDYVRAEPTIEKTLQTTSFKIKQADDPAAEANLRKGVFASWHNAERVAQRTLSLYQGMDSSLEKKRARELTEQTAAPAGPAKTKIKNIAIEAAPIEPRALTPIEIDVQATALLERLRPQLLSIIAMHQGIEAAKTDTELHNITIQDLSEKLEEQESLIVLACQILREGTPPVHRPEIITSPDLIEDEPEFLETPNNCDDEIFRISRDFNRYSVQFIALRDELNRHRTENAQLEGRVLSLEFSLTHATGLRETLELRADAYSGVDLEPAFR